MDFQSFMAAIAGSQSKKATGRERLLDALDRALDGELYRHISSPFSQEFASEYDHERISLDKRRPSAQARLPHVIARDLANYVFGEAHRPLPFVRDDPDTSAFILAYIEDTKLWWHLWDCLYQGQVGTGVLVTRVLSEDVMVDDAGATLGPKMPGRVFHEVWPAAECRPVFHRHAPDQLKQLTRTYEVSVDTLRADGYDVDALEEQWTSKRLGTNARGRRMRKALAMATKASNDWILRVELDVNGETWREPIPKWLYELDDFNESTEWRIDEMRSFSHNLGETTALWIRNAPTRHKRFPDGLCSFEPAIDFQFRIDRTVSQTGRAFDYAGDPQLALIEGDVNSGFGDEEEAPPGATASDSIPVGTGGDAKFVEISGEGLKIAIDTYVATLQRIAREVAPMSRIETDSKTGGELSGRAMRMLDQALFGFVGLLKLSWWDYALIESLRLGMRLYLKVQVSLPSLDAKLAAISPAAGGSPKAKDCKPNPAAYIELSGPPMIEPTGEEKSSEVGAIVSAKNGKIISGETAVANAAPLFDVKDAHSEHDRIQTETLASEERELELVSQSAQIKASFNVEPA